MGQDSLTVEERTRKNERVFLCALSEASQTEVARLTGYSEGDISKAKSPQPNERESKIERFSRMAAACGLKLVPAHMICNHPERVHALEVIAREALSGHVLSWEDGV